MSDISAKLDLMLPTQVDPFETSDVRANFEKIDAAPGSYICTSTTRPTWNTAKAGRKIYETDTGLEWVWDGTQFKRLAATGLLKCSDGSWAIAERATNASTASVSFVVAVAVSNVVIPDGLRPIRVDISWPSLGNPARRSAIAIYRSATNGSGPYQGGFFVSEDAAGGGGGSYFTIERNGLAAGVYSFSFQFRCTGTPGGTNVATIGGSSQDPISIFVSEM